MSPTRAEGLQGVEGPTKEVLGGGEDEEVGISIQTLLLNHRKASQINLLARNGARVRHKWIFLQLYGGGMALALVPSRPQQWHHPSRHSKHFPTGLMFSHRKYLLTGSSNSRHHHRGPSNCQHNRLWFSSSSKYPAGPNSGTTPPGTANTSPLD